MKSSCVTLELHKDEKYDMAEYNLDEYKDKDKLEYMRVSMAKMGYHIIKSAEAYESAFRLIFYSGFLSCCFKLTNMKCMY